MSYESFKSVKLSDWKNNITRLNQSNMNELKNAVQSNTDALMDANGIGVISDVRQLNTGLFGNSAVYEVGAEKKLESLNAFIFGEDYRAYTTSNGSKGLVIPTCVKELFQSTSSKITNATVIGSEIWNIGNVDLGSNEEAEKIPLVGHTGALAHLSISKTCSELNKLHLSKIEAVYQPNKIQFGNSHSSIESKDKSLYISSSEEVCVQFPTDAVAIKITRDGIIHTASSSLPSIGSESNRFSTVYAESLNLSGGASIGTTLIVNGKTSLNGNAEVKESLSVARDTTLNKTTAKSLDVNTQGEEDTSVVIKSTLDAKVSEMIGKDTDSKEALTLHGLSNAIEHYAVTWQVM